MKRKPPKQILIPIIVLEIVSAVFAWRDIARRSDASLRGKKQFWRVVIALNPGNSLAYWTLGRR